MSSFMSPIYSWDSIAVNWNDPGIRPLSEYAINIYECLRFALVERVGWANYQPFTPYYRGRLLPYLAIYVGWDYRGRRYPLYDFNRYDEYTVLVPQPVKIKYYPMMLFFYYFDKTLEYLVNGATRDEWNSVCYRGHSTYYIPARYYDHRADSIEYKSDQNVDNILTWWTMDSITNAAGISSLTTVEDLSERERLSDMKFMEGINEWITERYKIINLLRRVCVPALLKGKCIDLYFFGLTDWDATKQKYAKSNAWRHGGYNIGFMSNYNAGVYGITGFLGWVSVSTVGFTFSGAKKINSEAFIYARSVDNKDIFYPFGPITQLDKWLPAGIYENSGGGIYAEVYDQSLYQSLPAPSGRTAAIAKIAKFCIYGDSIDNEHGFMFLKT